MYEYKATYIKNYDGDTITFKIDLGFHVSITENIRVARIDTPELRGDEREKGLEVKRFVYEEMEYADKIIIRTNKDKTGKYGRYIAEVIYYKDNIEINLSDLLLKEGMAEPYGG